MTSPNPDALKAETRKNAARLRETAQAADLYASARIAEYAKRLVQHFHPRIVAGYWAIKTELDVIPLLAALGEVSDIRLCLPVTGPAETPLVFHHWHPGEPLDTGPYQTRQPFASTQPVIPDLMLVPLLAFDKNFNRLGYGGGFYDRTLASFARTGDKVAAIGVGFDVQEMENLPLGPFDRPLDGVLTPSGLRLVG